MTKKIMHVLLLGVMLMWSQDQLAQSTAHDCNTGQLISIIGKNNYEKARRGQPVNPREFAESSQKAIVTMEKEVADVQKLLSALGVQSTAQAQATILGYQAQLEGSVGSHELEATIKSTAERIKEKKTLLQEADQKLKELDATLQELEKQQNMPTQTCDAQYKSRTQEYAKVIGQQNSEAINAAVEQKIANPTTVQHPDQLLKLAFFPPESSITQAAQAAKKNLDAEVDAAQKKLEELNKQKEVAKAKLGNQQIVLPQPIPQSTPSPASTQQLTVEPAPQLTPQVSVPASPTTPSVIPVVSTPQVASPSAVAAPATTSSAMNDCEKKLIKIRMALNTWSTPSYLGYGAWYNDYLEPTVKNKELSEQIKKDIGFKPAELDKLSDCEKKVAIIQLVQKRYEYEKKVAVESNQTGYNELMERYIGPILNDTDWNQNAGISPLWGGASDYEVIKDYNKKALSDPRKNTFGITKEEFEAIFGKQ